MDPQENSLRGVGPLAPESPGRRLFLRQVALSGAGCALAPYIEFPDREQIPGPAGRVKFHVIVNGRSRELSIDPRLTLLDALRETMHLFGTKKGCDRGQCGACTVLVNDRRVNSCLTLAAACQDAVVTTIEGLARGEDLHPMQKAFIKHDAFQCGYCTPGQICSAIGLMKEGQAKTDAGIREGMSGNICRCGAYQHILEAIKEVIHQPYAAI